MERYSLGFVRGGTDNRILDLLAYNNELYVSGIFENAEGLTARGIAKWNGTAWDSLGLFNWVDLVGGVWTIQDYNGEIYVGGAYLLINPPGNNIARWNGNTWNSVGIGNEFQSTTIPVLDVMATYNNDLYVAGIFVGQSYPGNNIARWDGTEWSDVGGGINNRIWDLAVFNNELYAVGEFTTAGGVPAQNIAKWDGNEWCGFGSSFNGPIYTVAASNNELYIGGAFTSIDGDTMNYVAKWIGGNFTDSCGVLIGIEEETKTDDTGLNIYPNPTTGLITVTGLSQKPARITVYNVLGELVHDMEMNEPNDQSVDLATFPSGLYLVHLQQGQNTFRKKVIKQ